MQIFCYIYSASLQLADSVAWLFWVILQMFWSVCSSLRVWLQFHCIDPQVKISYHIFNFKEIILIIFLATEHFCIFNNKKVPSLQYTYQQAIFVFFLVCVCLCVSVLAYVWLCVHVYRYDPTCEDWQATSRVVFQCLLSCPLDNLS